jgi:hypothetical protein
VGIRIHEICFVVETLDHKDRGRARRALVLAGAVAVVHCVSEGGAAVFGHFAVAAQYMLFRICWAAWVGPAGACCTKLPGRLVLICEEGLVPPINTIVQINVLANVTATNETVTGTRRGSNSLRGIWRGRSSGLPSSSRSRERSWQRECPRH